MMLSLVKLGSSFSPITYSNFFYLVANFKNLNVQTLPITQYRYTPVF